MHLVCYKQETSKYLHEPQRFIASDCFGLVASLAMDEAECTKSVCTQHALGTQTHTDTNTDTIKDFVWS